MKAVLFVLFALVVVASCQGGADGQVSGGKWTQEQLEAHLNQKYGEGVCINVNCRNACRAQGNKSGYCATNLCTCVPTVPAQ